eukprot:264477_1
MSNVSYNLNKKDKILALVGLGGPWFLINSWSEEETKESKPKKYLSLYNKYKIWELMFESFPSVGLQIYALLVQNNVSISIILSILISIISITYSTWIYLVNLSQQSYAAANANKKREMEIEQKIDDHENDIELRTITKINNIDKQETDEKLKQP